MENETEQRDDTNQVSNLQNEAWANWNRSYHVPDGEPYRLRARELYEQDMHRRVEELFARLDEQNKLVDEALAPAREESAGPCGTAA